MVERKSDLTPEEALRILQGSRSVVEHPVDHVNPTQTPVLEDKRSPIEERDRKLTPQEMAAENRRRMLERRGIVSPPAPKIDPSSSAAIENAEKGVERFRKELRGSRRHGSR